jgi:hypothetical protein
MAFATARLGAFFAALVFMALALWAADENIEYHELNRLSRRTSAFGEWPR